MPVDPTAKTRRGYLTIEELEDFADITVTDQTESLERIEQAEELIDQYVGFQDKHLLHERNGFATAGTINSLTDRSVRSPLTFYDDYYKGCEVEIVAGTGIGQRRTVATYTYSTQTMTFTENWDTAPDATSVYRLRQVGKFPRRRDRFSDPNGTHFYFYIPEMVKRATAAQVQFMINKGDDFFGSDGPDMQSESLGNYSYSKGSGAATQSASVKMLAPRARALLREIKNSTGRIVVDNPTWQ